MRRPTAVLAAAAGMATCLLAGMLTAAPAAAQDTPAARALGYLLTLQSSDGSIDPSSPAAPRPTQEETADTVLGAVALARKPNSLHVAAGASALDYLAAHSVGLTPESADAAAAPTAQVILAMVAAGMNPRRVGDGGLDLVRRLEVQDKSDHIYGFGDTRAQAFGLLAEVASGTPVDAAAAARLRAMQNPDGSWNEGVSAGAPGDTNATAMAVMALMAAEHTLPRHAQLLAYLHVTQNLDGGFPEHKPAADGDTNSNPLSDGLVIQALVSLGQDPGR
ncbi:MAG: hypothetical protein ABR541_07055, partial [Candidatus Dormibacteria bacterium]